jgi:Fe-S-cluster-containing dehydrogenase component/DMSO reductase anchor subunit
MQKGFLFDLNKCTGCNACQIACSLENEVQLPINWRQVNTFNQSRHPEIPVFNASMACNHCIDPPCLKYCPALAISKEENTGAVIINQNLCIGCKYCSWVCPYDAPVFNTTNGMTEKCTLCLHRLDEDLDPACVALCPTSALQLSIHRDDIQTEPISGFTISEIKPAIQFIPLREDQLIPEIADVPFDEAIVRQFRDSLSKNKKPEKITCRAEWPLVLFSLIIAFTTGSLVPGIVRLPETSGILPVILCFIAFFTSTIHLGKKLRAPRAILNIRNSWLSREIAFFIAFFVLLSLNVLIFPGENWLASLAFIMGFLTLYALDKVYSVIALVEKQNYHSANTFLTGLFFAALFSEFMFGIIVFGGIKLTLYLKQLSGQLKGLKISTYLSATFRLGFGFIIPLIFWYFTIPETWTMAIILILIAELIDRCDFYEQLKTITPAKQMAMDLEKILTTKDTK